MQCHAIVGIGEILWDVFPDGKRILVVEPIGNPPEPTIHIVQNWYEDFRNRRQN